MSNAEKDEPDVVSRFAQLGDRPDHRQRVEPVPDPARPQENPACVVDARNDAAHRAATYRWLGFDPEGNDIDQAAERGIRRVAPVIDAPQREQRPKPEVALLLARTDEGVSVAQDRLLG